MSRQNKVGRILKEVRLNASMNRLSAFARKNDLPRYVFRCKSRFLCSKLDFARRELHEARFCFFLKRANAKKEHDRCEWN